MEANIPCPHCNKSLTARFDQVGPGKGIPCPNCGATIRFSGEDLGQVQEAVAQLAGQIGNNSIKVKVRTRIHRPWWKFWSH